jgi:hypothetical protein
MFSMKFLIKCECRKVPHKSAIIRSVSKCRTTGTIFDENMGVVGEKKAMREKKTLHMFNNHLRTVPYYL